MCLYLLNLHNFIVSINDFVRVIADLVCWCQPQWLCVFIMNGAEFKSFPLMKCLVLPPLTTPFVQMADMERQVMVVTTQLRRMITIPKPVIDMYDNSKILVFHWQLTWNLFASGQAQSTALHSQHFRERERESQRPRATWGCNLEQSSVLVPHNACSFFSASQTLLVTPPEQKLPPINRFLSNKHTHKAIHTFSTFSPCNTNKRFCTLNWYFCKFR